MPITNARYQYPVGQGGFHTGTIEEKGAHRLSYVYDCGAMHRYSGERQREIGRYIKRVGAGSRLDLLFISHVHADHLNGLEQLLDPVDGLRVETIVLPLVNAADRLIAFARTASEDPASAENGFYREFVVDPGAALERFGPARIIFVEAGDRDDGAPDGGERPFDPPDGGKMSGGEWDEAQASRPAWVLVGRGTIRRLEEWPELGFSGAGGAPQYLMPDTLAMMTAAAAQGEWLLAPFVDPTVTAHRKLFLKELARQCAVPLAQLDTWLASTANLQRQVTVDRDRLAAAYGAVAGNLNITSLCLYSGPARGSSAALPRHGVGVFGCVHDDRDGPASRIAWLGTGDAALKQKQRRSDFVAHYGQLLLEVGTLMLPHHGSDGNFDPDLLDKVGARICVAAADRFGTWKHPGPHAVQAVCSRPAVLQVVTSKQPSRAWERSTLG